MILWPHVPNGRYLRCVSFRLYLGWIHTHHRWWCLDIISIWAKQSPFHRWCALKTFRNWDTHTEREREEDRYNEKNRDRAVWDWMFRWTNCEMCEWNMNHLQGNTTTPFLMYASSLKIIHKTHSILIRALKSFYRHFRPKSNQYVGNEQNDRCSYFQFCKTMGIQ